jgi:hypothetical protein
MAVYNHELSVLFRHKAADATERAQIDGQIESLTSRVSSVSKMIANFNVLLTSYSQSKLELVNLSNQVSNASSVSGSSKPMYMVKLADLPAFSVKSVFRSCTEDGLDPAKAIINRNGEHSLNAFITKFEAVLQASSLNLDDSWENYLKLCMQKDKSASDYYQSHIGSKSVGDEKSTLTWKQVKKILAAKYDPAANATPFVTNCLLSNIKQAPTENLIHYMERFEQHLVAAKINVFDCYFYVVHFLCNLNSKALKEKICLILKGYHNTMVLKGMTGSTADSKYATNGDDVPIPASFHEFEKILYDHQYNLSLFVAENKSASSSSASSSSPEVVGKKRRFNPSNGTGNKSAAPSSVPSVPSVSGEKVPGNKDDRLLYLMDNPSTRLSDEDFNILRKAGRCTRCRVVKFTNTHYEVCAGVKKDVKVPNHMSNVNNIVNKNTDRNIFISRKIDDVIPVDTLFESSDDEYEAACVKYDQQLLNGDDYEKHNKNLFCIQTYSSSSIDKKVLTSSLPSLPKKRKNLVGDIDNPFETKSVGYACDILT